METSDEFLVILKVTLSSGILARRVMEFGRERQAVRLQLRRPVHGKLGRAGLHGVDDRVLEVVDRVAVDNAEVIKVQAAACHGAHGDLIAVFIGGAPGM